MAVVRETRNVQAFDQIMLKSSGEIQLVQGEQEGLVIEAEEDILPRIKSEVIAGRLELGPKHLLDTFSVVGARIIFHVSVKNIRQVSIAGAGKLESAAIRTGHFKLQVSGSADIDILHVEAQELEIGISGSAAIAIGGAVQREDLHISGHGSVHARDLDCQEARVRISGAGEATLKVQQSLEVVISGAGQVAYLGDPKLRQSISGAGQVRRIEAGS